MPPSDEQVRFTPVLKAAERRLATLGHGEQIYLSTEDYERVLRHAMGIIKTMLDARRVQ